LKRCTFEACYAQRCEFMPSSFAAGPCRSSSSCVLLYKCALLQRVRTEALQLCRCMQRVRWCESERFHCMRQQQRQTECWSRKAMRQHMYHCSLFCLLVLHVTGTECDSPFCFSLRAVLPPCTPAGVCTGMQFVNRQQEFSSAGHGLRLSVCKHVTCTLLQAHCKSSQGWLEC
jgi:hypothetical protein